MNSNTTAALLKRPIEAPPMAPRVSASCGEPRSGDEAWRIPTIFHQPWWLEIAAAGSYDIVESKRNGRVVGQLPFATLKRFGYTFSHMPPLTHFLGPAIDEGTGSANTRFLQRLAITQDLLSKLPKMAHFKQKLHYGVSDTLPFQMAGYRSSVQFTHEIAPQPEANIWRGFRDKTRNMVRKASREMVCETLDDPDAFIRLYKQNLAYMGVPSTIDLQTSARLIGACVARQCGRILVARGNDGRVSTGIFYAWDNRACYYIMATRTPGSGNSGNTFLLWEAIKHAASRGLIFDFDGVASSGAVLFFAGFGAVIQPRYIVVRSGRLAQVMLDVRELLGHENSTFF